MSMANHIDSLNLEIIDVCNLRCKHCDIWMNQNLHKLEWEDVHALLSSKYVDSDTDISITGGEIFLHENIGSIILSIYREGFRVHTLSTNGTHEEKVVALLSEIQKNNFPLPGIHISFDGNEENHDFQRGLRWAFRTAIRTVQSLQEKFPEVQIKLKCTLTSKNIADVPFLWYLAQKLEVWLGLKPVENDPYYTNRKFPPILLSKDEKKSITVLLEKLYKNKDPYINRLSYFLENDVIDFSCTTPEKSLFVMADGKVYCCTKYEDIGNIKEQRIDDILFSGKHSDIISDVQKTDCRKCFSYHWSYKSLIWTI